jgi:uncharacterized protein
MELPFFLLLLFFIVAFIYGSVGHGGASGYLAVLTLTGFFSPAFVPVVLVLNILVSSVALYNYGSRGHFHWNLFWPFALASVPAAFFGGVIQFEVQAFYITAGLVLIVMAVILFYRTFHKKVKQKYKSVNIPAALLFGAGVGYFSGLMGVGGGIFLSPLIYFLGWGSMRQIAAVSALFIFVNSLSGLAGHAMSTQILWSTALSLSLPVLAGGYLGSRIGVKTVKPDYIQILLAVVLVIAGIKMLAQHAI